MPLNRYQLTKTLNFEDKTSEKQTEKRSHRRIDQEEVNQTHQTVNQVKIPERIAGNRRRSHSRVNQEEVNQTHQAENQVEILSWINRTTASSKSIAGRGSYQEPRAGTETSAQEAKCSDKSTWRICQPDPKTPPTDKQSVQVTQETGKRRQHWHRTHRRYPVQ